MLLTETIAQLQDFLARSRRLVFLTGAGISTESGIPDFRSPSGIYSDPANADLFDISSFLRDPQPFYCFAQKFLPLLQNSLPNRAHLAIARLQQNHNVIVVTQNVDALHQKAGSKNVWCLHGDFEFSTCVNCGFQLATRELYPAIRRGEVPYHGCGGFYKPMVTFFGESLPQSDWLHSQEAILAADLLCVVGSSLTVYPAARLPLYRSPNCALVIVNLSPTPQDSSADLVIHDPAGEVFGRIEVGALR